MPIRVKYVGPLDEKFFRGYFFKRDVSDDATGGANAVELPDNIANEALKHRDVFMQWNLAVPAAVKALRAARPGAMRKEGEEGRTHWYKRLVVAEMLEDDTPRKKQIRANEIAGAKAQVDHFQGLINEADRLEAGTAGKAPVAAGPIGGDIMDLLAGLRDALNNAQSTNQELRAELLAMKDQMQRDGRLTPDEEIEAPSTGEFGVAVSREEAPPAIDVEAEPAALESEGPPVDFPADIFEPAPEPAPTIKRGRPAAAK